MTLPKVALVGRPNVGKSTLFNRIVGRREAIVEEMPGVTRDRKETEVAWLQVPFLLVDTGGWMREGSALDKKVSEQSQHAINESDVVVFVVDSAVGVTDEDEAVGALLRQRKKPVILVANKVDDPSHEDRLWDLYTLGLGQPMPISAIHGRGSGDLLDHIVAAFDPAYVALHRNPAGADEDDFSVEGTATGGESKETERAFGIAIVGRPNVGKSTLFNKLIGEDRAVVHDMAGTTRDSVDTIIETDGVALRFIDTAGMRRKSRIESGPEYFSFVRALQSVDTADVALLVIDATEGVTHQDQRLAERVDLSGCPIVIVLNKWELVEEEQRDDVLRMVTRKLHFLGAAPVLRISALSGKNVHKLFPAIEDSLVQYRKRISTRLVNDVIRGAQQAQAAPKGARVLYATQGAVDPPTFTFFTNSEIPASYLRYLERKLRENFDLRSTPIKIRVRQRRD